MEYSCDNKSFYSHPDILLKDHLRVVGEMCETKIRDILGDNELSNIAKIIGLTHDFGKYHIFFQEYLRSKKRRNKELISHAPLSSFYTGWVLKEVLHEQISDPFLIYAAMLCVYCHHRSIDLSFRDLKERFDIINNYNYQNQLTSLHQNSHIISRELNELNLLPIDYFLDNLDGIIKDFKRLFYSIKDNSSYSEALTNLYRLLLLFSVLIDSDKKVASNIGEFNRVDIPVYIVDNYIENRLKNKNNNILDELRNNIRVDALNNLKILLDEGIQPILSINAPTGSGKTLLALNVALRIRERLKEKTNKHFRIIYVLPYINIIEQTYNVFAEVLGNKVTPSLLIKHHHLYYPEEKNGEELDNDTRFMLIESWDSEIIVTTLVQFMETLLGTRNRMLKKFHKLFNSIIILDEIQAVPLNYWLLLRESVKALSQYSYIIFMTATKPIIFKSNEYKELVTNPAYNFKLLDRVQYRVNNNTINIDDFANMINNEWKNSNSLLIIVNKIRTSIQLYNKLKEILLHGNYDVICVEKVNGSILEYKDLRDGRSYKTEIEKVDKPVLVYLSTNIVPKERINRIQLLACLLKKKHKILVLSTQLVEAGVDLDFDMVIRDIGPFDSIIQAAGRCNRNGGNDKGSVLIVRLSNDKEGLDAVDVYGELTISVTRDVLEGVDTFTESDIFDMINKYYNLVNQKLNTDKSDESIKYLDYIKEFNLQGLSEFKVIKEEPRTSVFVEIDSDASSTLKKFKEVLYKSYDDKYSVYKRRAEIRQSRIRLEEYIINTWYSKNLPTQTIADVVDIKYIDTQNINIYYNYETGLNIGSEVNDSYEFL